MPIYKSLINDANSQIANNRKSYSQLAELALNSHRIGIILIHILIRHSAGLVFQGYGLVDISKKTYGSLHPNHPVIGKEIGLGTKIIHASGIIKMLVGNDGTVRIKNLVVINSAASRS